MKALPPAINGVGFHFPVLYSLPKGWSLCVPDGRRVDRALPNAQFAVTIGGLARNEGKAGYPAPGTKSCFQRVVGVAGPLLFQFASIGRTVVFG
jgi:hypothetical protein